LALSLLEVNRLQTYSTLTAGVGTVGGAPQDISG
jgi:hypothetical protein